MRILVLTSIANRHNYFANEIINAFEDEEVYMIKEPKASKGKKKSIIQKFLLYKNKATLLKNLIINIFYYKYKRIVIKEKKEEEIKYFKELDSQKLKRLNSLTLCSVTEGKTINDFEYVEKIKEFAPDLIVVMGTSLIKDEIIKIPKLGILNIHTGLSPYYRGGMTNFWPFIYKEVGFCGVTIHKLDLGIDSGDLIFHGLPEIEENDNFSSINCKSIIVGTRLMIDTINEIRENRLKTIKQWNEGKLFFNKDFNGYYAYKYVKSYKKVIKTFLENKKFPKKVLLNETNN